VSELTAEQLATKTRVSRAVLRAAAKVRGSMINAEERDGDLLFEAADNELDQVIIAFLKGFRNDKIQYVLSEAQRASEREGQTLEGWEVEVESHRGEKKILTLTRDHIFQLETGINPPVEEEETPSGNGTEQKTIEDVISGYAQLTATQIADKMKALPDEDIEFIKEHEGAGEDRPAIINFPGDEQHWQGEEEESKEYEQEQEAPADDNFVLDRDLTKEELREDVDEIFKKYFKEADYDKRRNTSIEKKIGEFTPDEIRTLLDYESLPYEKGGPRHRDNVIKFLKQTLAEIAKTQPELVDEEQVAEVPAPEPDPEEPKFNPATQQMESVADLIDEGRQERESRQDEIQQLREERLEGRQETELAPELPLVQIQPRQQGAIQQEDLNQRVLKKLADLGLPEPEIPSEVPQFPSDLDNGVSTDPMLDKQIALFGVNEGYAAYHANHYEAEATAKKAMADKAAHELRKTIGRTDVDGKHLKLEAQIEAEVETHPTVAVYREEQRIAESLAKKLHGNAAFYASCKWALHGVRDRRRESQKGPQ
jgi:hypothetical protein